MQVSRSKMFVLFVAFALVFFVGLPKALFAHPAAAKATLAFAQQGGQDDNKQQGDANKKDENQDLNDDRQEGPNDELNDDKDMDQQEGLNQEQGKESAVQEMDGADHNGNFQDGDVNEDRVEDQQQDQHEDADAPPPSL